jgi:hypothetical protein
MEVTIKDVGPQNASAQVLDGKPRPIMLLDPDRLGIRYVSQLFVSKPSNVTTNGGRSLPLELWIEILDIVAEEEKPLYFVQGLELHEFSTHKILRCRKVNTDLPQISRRR